MKLCFLDAYNRLTIQKLPENLPRFIYAKTRTLLNNSGSKTHLPTILQLRDSQRSSGISTTR